MLTEDSPPEADLGLSLVDVITNGLGAMLVLFFVVVLVQGSLEWSAADKTPTQAVKPAADPFVLMVQSSGKLFDPASAENVWRYSGFSADSISAQRGANWDWGDSHAIFLGPGAPGPRAEIQVRTQAAAAEIRLELHHGERHESCTLAAPANGDWVTVWPWPGSKTP